MLPCVSIVTPSLNQGTFITATINSVITQSYPQIEYIVMDGGSSDNTLQVLQQYGEQLRYLTECDEGQSAAINRGWKLTRGEIVAWLNADDFLLPGAVKAAVEAFQQYPQAAFVYGDCHYVNESGKMIGQYATRPYDYANLVKSATNYIPSIALFIRRTALEQIGMLDQSLHFMMDYDLCLRLGQRYMGVHVPQPFAAMRLHASAKSFRSLAKFGDELVVLLERHFAQLATPNTISQLKTEALTNAKLKAAHAAYWGGHFTHTQQWLQQLDRSSLNTSQLWAFARLLSFSYLRKPGLRLAKTILGNPYLPHSNKPEPTKISNINHSR